ncbi:hypothetical protein QAD02_013626 [Eretmocerus hayati]|uniref:Uncharacterized protein n=1 Tax=Eretmocerus hayati TaxID=131215 RepID=A0ACC2P5M2_9HYME|nr:hypothetical protein QAD02_013626 [Eretmocerus hayati]
MHSEFISDEEVARPLEEHHSTEPTALWPTTASSLRDSRTTSGRPLSPIPSSADRSTTTRHVDLSEHSRLIFSDMPRPPFSPAPSQAQITPRSRNRCAGSSVNTSDQPRSPLRSEPHHSKFDQKSPSPPPGTTYHRARFPVSYRTHQAANIAPSRERLTDDSEYAHSRLRSPAPSAVSRGLSTHNSPSYRPGITHRARIPALRGPDQAATTPPSRKGSTRDSGNTYDLPRSPDPSASFSGSFARQSPTCRSKTANPTRFPVSCRSEQPATTLPSRNRPRQDSEKIHGLPRSPALSVSSRGSFARKSPRRRSGTAHTRPRSPPLQRLGQAAFNPLSRNRPALGPQNPYDHPRSPLPSTSFRGSFTRKTTPQRPKTAYSRIRSPEPSGPGKAAFTPPSRNRSTHGSQNRPRPPLLLDSTRELPNALSVHGSPPNKRHCVGQVEGCEWLSRPISDEEKSRVEVAPDQSRVTNKSESPSLLDPPKRQKRTLQILSSSSSSE